VHIYIYETRRHAIVLGCCKVLLLHDPLLSCPPTLRIGALGSPRETNEIWALSFTASLLNLLKVSRSVFCEQTRHVAGVTNEDGSAACFGTSVPQGVI